MAAHQAAAVTTTAATPAPDDAPGLSADEAARRLAAEGRNELPTQRRRSDLSLLFEVLRELTTPRATVLRGGWRVVVDGRDVVRGD